MEYAWTVDTDTEELHNVLFVIVFGKQCKKK